MNKPNFNMGFNNPYKSYNITIVKLTDDEFDGYHPNGIYAGYVKTGICTNPPTIGDRFYIGYSFSTSPVTELIDNLTFKTLYSTYKIKNIELID